MDNCFFNIKENKEGVGELITSYSILYLLGGLGIVSILWVLYNVYLHLKYFSKGIQSILIRIHLLVPVTIIFNILGYRYPVADLYLNCFLRFYSAYLSIEILNLLIGIIEKDDLTILELCQNRKSKNLIFPLNSIQYQPSDKAFLPKVTMGILQFIVIIGLCQIVKLITIPQLQLCPHELGLTISPNFYLDFVSIISAIVMTYCIYLMFYTFYTDITLHLSILDLFLLLLLILLPWIQSLIIGLFIHFGAIPNFMLFKSESVGIMITNGLTLIEMILFSIFLSQVFNYKKYYTYTIHAPSALLNQLNKLISSGTATSMFRLSMDHYFLNYLKNEHLRSATANNSLIYPKSNLSQNKPQITTLKKEPDMAEEVHLPSLKTLRRLSILRMDQEFYKKHSETNTQPSKDPEIPLKANSKIISSLSDMSISNLSSISSLDFNRTDINKILFED